MGIAAFWIAVAAFIVVGALNSRRAYELKHETIRLLLEKDEKIDESILRELMTSSLRYRAPPPGQGYRAMRIVGTLLLFLAPGLTLLIVLTSHFRADSTGVAAAEAAGIAVGIMLALIAVGLHVACRFVPRPPDQDVAR